MVGSAIAWLALKSGLSRRLVIAGLIAAGVLILIAAAGIYISGERREAVERDRLESNLDAERGKSVADEKAAETRRDDDSRLAEETRELDKVIDNAPDAATARREHYRCIRLQQAARAGGLPAPSCAGPDLP